MKKNDHVKFIYSQAPHNAVRITLSAILYNSTLGYTENACQLRKKMILKLGSYCGICTVHLNTGIKQETKIFNVLNPRFHAF